MKRLSPFTFVLADSDRSTFERTWYAKSPAEALKMVRVWATSNGYTFVGSAAVMAK